MQSTKSITFSFQNSSTIKTLSNENLVEEVKLVTEDYESEYRGKSKLKTVAHFWMFGIPAQRTDWIVLIENSTSVKLSIERLMEQVKPVVTEK